MRYALLGTLASCILFFAACGGDDDGAEPAPAGDGGVGGSSGSSGASGSSSGSSSGGPTNPDGGGPAGDDDDDPAIANLPPSCKASKGKGPGIDTCGASEPGGDSCCKSLTLPTTKTRTLDKYEITAGRIRAFIASLGADGNLRKYAKDYAAAHPTSQLGRLEKDYPKYLDVIPDHAGPTGDDAQLPLWLGAFPNDLINTDDGCFLGPNGYGAATYWQPPATLKEYGIGYTKPTPDGVRKYDQGVLDAKPMNCVPPLLLAAFCAWDGGELATPEDYREVWGQTTTTLPGGTKVTVPWNEVLPWKQFNWRNGHAGNCPAGWPGCSAADTSVFYSFPTGGKPADDDTPEIGAPGRFPKDVTKIVSDDGSGWFDIGGNLLEAAWPNTKLDATAENYCNTAGSVGAGAQACNRAADGEPRKGHLLYKGKNPAVALIGYSFEVHARYGEKYFAAAQANLTNLASYLKPAHFQYGKTGGRCARVK